MGTAVLTALIVAQFYCTCYAYIVLETICLITAFTLYCTIVKTVYMTDMVSHGSVCLWTIALTFTLDSTY